MIMEIHSSYGLLVCTPLELQAVEKSIPEVTNTFLGNPTEAVAEAQESAAETLDAEN